MLVICDKCLDELPQDCDLNELGTLYIEQEVLANGSILWIHKCTKNKDHTTTWTENPKNHELTGCTQRLSREEVKTLYSEHGLPKDWIEKYVGGGGTINQECYECVKKNCAQALKKHYGYFCINDGELATYDPKLLFHDHGFGEYTMHPILRKHKQNGEK